jgi:type I restriction enzyme, R subunit
MISKYMVLVESEQKLLIMRPYQIYAVKAIGYTAKQLNAMFEAFKEDKYKQELADIAHKYGLQTAALNAFVEKIMDRMIFDGEKLTDLLAPLELGWKERRTKELALMTDLVPHLKKLAQGHEISGLKAYE